MHGQTATTTTRPAAFASHAFTNTSNICGQRSTFERKQRSIRETSECTACRSSLRYRAQADVLIKLYGAAGITCFAELVGSRRWQSLKIYEPGIIGPFRRHLRD